MGKRKKEELSRMGVKQNQFHASGAACSTYPGLDEVTMTIRANERQAMYLVAS